MMMKKKPKHKSRIEDYHCPKCGMSVFKPRDSWRSWVPDAKPNEPVVMCSDMGHWIGKLSECK